jgi:hypothetical protein
MFLSLRGRRKQLPWWRLCYSLSIFEVSYISKDETKVTLNICQYVFSPSIKETEIAPNAKERNQAL